MVVKAVKAVMVVMVCKAVEVVKAVNEYGIRPLPHLGTEKRLSSPAAVVILSLSMGAADHSEGSAATERSWRQTRDTRHRSPWERCRRMDRHISGGRRSSHIRREDQIRIISR